MPEEEEEDKTVEEDKIVEKEEKVGVKISDNEKIVDVKISDEYTMFAKVLLGVYILAVALLLILGFVYGSGEDSIGWFSLTFSCTRYSGNLFTKKFYTGNFLLFLLIFVICIVMPITIALWVKKEKEYRKLSVFSTRVECKWTIFIPVLFLPVIVPIAHIRRIIPMEKIDNITAAESMFFLYTGKAIVIKSTSGRIAVPYVLNADEVVDCITETIKNITHKKGNEEWSNSGGYIESI